MNNYNNECLFEIKNGSGKGKEYDFNGNLIYEGEYLNGVKNGKGKENIQNELFFEGEYLDGKRWNGIIKITKVDRYGNETIYEGELKDGQKHGKGKEYDYERLKFEGEYLNGSRHGKGKEYFNNLEICEEFYHDLIK